MSENTLDTSVIRVLIVDDHPLTRQGIRTILEQAPDIEVVGEAADGTEAMALVEQLHPDVVLLDVEMPGPRAWEVEAWIRHNYPDITRLLLSAHNRDEYLSEMMEAGAVGYLDKHIPAPQLVQAIRRAVQGEYLLRSRAIAPCAPLAHRSAGAVGTSVAAREGSVASPWRKRPARAKSRNA